MLKLNPNKNFNYTDERALSPVIGFILIIQILIIFLSVVQTTVLPSTFKKVEYENIKEVQKELTKFSSLSLTGEEISFTISTPRYPNYLFLLSPESASYSINTEPVTINLSYTEILPNGSKIRTFKSYKSNRLYITINNYFYSKTTFIFENTALFSKSPSGIATISKQKIIDSSINIPIIFGNLSSSYNSPKDFVFQVASSGGYIYAENISISFESVYPDYWRSVKNASVNGNRVTIHQSSGILRIIAYSLNEEVNREPYRVVKLNPFDTYNLSVGDSKELGVVVLDRFNNPVSGVEVNVLVNGGIGSVIPQNLKTDSAGRAYTNFKAENTGNGEVIFRTSGKYVSYRINVLSPSGIVKGGLFNVEWINKLNLDSKYGNQWDVGLEGNTKRLKVRVTYNGNPVPNAGVNFVVSNPSVIELNSNTAITGLNGEANITAYAKTNGSVKIFAFSGDAGDVLNLSITNTTIWHYIGWKYRIPIYIKEMSGKDLTDFQVLITLDSNFNWSAVKSDGSDIRFIGISSLDYWIEEWNYGSSAKIWVRLPSIPANQNITIYMYYGNSSATPKSNGRSVFLFFDDFDDGDVSDWHKKNAKISVKNFMGKKVLKLEPKGRELYQHLAVPNNCSINEETYIVGAYIYDERPAGGLLFHYVDDKNWWSLELYPPSFDIFRPYIRNDKGWVYTKSPSSISANTWYKIEVVAHPDSFEMYINGELKWTQAISNAYRLNGYSKVGFVEHKGFGPLYADYIYVRKYTIQEPQVTIGNEEKYQK